jgi:hypothetical protein|tara:strand:+ start:8345 stop:8584 length:240 start_codon:yes stop_codon:yes gene_type:complete
MAGITRYKITKTTTAIQFVDVDTDNDDVSVFSTSEDHWVVMEEKKQTEFYQQYDSIEEARGLLMHTDNAKNKAEYGGTI